MAGKEKHSEKKYGFRVRLDIKIAQKNQQFLKQLNEELGMGKVRFFNQKVYEYDLKDQFQIGQFI